MLIEVPAFAGMTVTDHVVPAVMPAKAGIQRVLVGVSNRQGGAVFDFVESEA